MQCTSNALPDRHDPPAAVYLNTVPAQGWSGPRAAGLLLAIEACGAHVFGLHSQGVRTLEMTNFQQLFQLGQQVQAQLSQLQTELGNRTVTSTAGGGMVTVTADGKGRVREIRIDPSVVDPGDVEMLEDLVIAAVNEAQQRAEKIYEEEMKKVAGGFPLPFNLPNLP
jgi:DNA-binding YbaB/EbfC family protein